MSAAAASCAEAAWFKERLDPTGEGCKPYAARAWAMLLKAMVGVLGHPEPLAEIAGRLCDCAERAYPLDRAGAGAGAIAFIGRLRFDGERICERIPPCSNRPGLNDPLRFSRTLMQHPPMTVCVAFYLQLHRLVAGGKEGATGGVIQPFDNSRYQELLERFTVDMAARTQ